MPCFLSPSVALHLYLIYDPSLPGPVSHSNRTPVPPVPVLLARPPRPSLPCQVIDPERAEALLFLANYHRSVGSLKQAEEYCNRWVCGWVGGWMGAILSCIARTANRCLYRIIISVSPFSRVVAFFCFFFPFILCIFLLSVRLLIPLFFLLLMTLMLLVLHRYPCSLPLLAALARCGVVWCGADCLSMAGAASGKRHGASCGKYEWVRERVSDSYSGRMGEIASE